MTDVVTHAEIKRTQQQLEQLKTDIAAARQELSDVRNVAAGSVIKSVQRGVIQIVNGSTSASATVSSVNTNKSELRFLGKETTYSQPFHYEVTLVLESSTNVKVSRYGVGENANPMKVSFELTEYY